MGRNEDKLGETTSSARAIKSKGDSLVVFDDRTRAVARLNAPLPQADGEELWDQEDPPPFAEKADALKLAIEQDKLQMEKSFKVIQMQLRELKNQSEDAQDVFHQAKEQLNNVRHWQEWVRANPWRSVGIGAALGFMLGSLT